MGNEQENLNPEAQAAEMADDTQAQAAMAEVGADVEGLKARIAELEDAFLRARAEGENQRRRAQEDVQKAHKFAVEKFARELLPVKDCLEMALLDNSSIDNIKAGVEMTLRQLASAFEKAQLKEINPMGQKLDPHQHQAMGVLEADAEPNTVVQVMQKGYFLADRVLRPAMVMVAKAKEASDAS